MIKLYIVHDPTGAVISDADVANMTMLGVNVLTFCVDDDDISPRKLFFELRTKLAEMLLGEPA